MELMQLIEDWQGYVAAGDIPKPEGYEQRLMETINLLSNASGLPSHRHEYLLREAMTTSDFPNLFGDVLDRQVLANYKAVDPVWKAICRQSTVPRISPQVGGYRFAITGGDQVLARVGEKGEYLASSRDEARYPISVDKYGRQFDISWETLINDDLGALKDTPERFARAAVRTEHRLATVQYAYNDTGGGLGNVVHAVGGPLYSMTAPEINMVNTLLSIAALETGVETMGAFVDAAGEPIMNRAKYLVVPPALEMTARQILTSTNKMWTAAAGAAIAYPTNNVIAQYGLTLIVDPYAPLCSQINRPATPNSANTQWYLFADPRDIAAFETAHLAGHERPEICMKASDKVSVGGGAIGPMSGDFATDNVFYRVRLVFGAAPLDWRATYAGGLTNT